MDRGGVTPSLVRMACRIASSSGTAGEGFPEIEARRDRWILVTLPNGESVGVPFGEVFRPGERVPAGKRPLLKAVVERAPGYFERYEHLLPEMTRGSAAPEVEVRDESWGWRAPWETDWRSWGYGSEEEMREEVGEELDHDPHDPRYRAWAESRRGEEEEALGRPADYGDEADRAVMRDWRKERGLR